MDAAAEAEARIMTGDADVIRDRVNEIEKQLEDTQVPCRGDTAAGVVGAV
jgi:hypothetical protein